MPHEYEDYESYTPERLEIDFNKTKEFIAKYYQDYCIADNIKMNQEKEDVKTGCKQYLDRMKEDDSKKRKDELKVLFTNHFKNKRAANKAELEKLFTQMSHLVDSMNQWEKDSEKKFTDKFNDIGNKLLEANDKHKTKNIASLQAKETALKKEYDQFQTDKELIGKIQGLIDQKIKILRKARLSNYIVDDYDFYEYENTNKALENVKATLKSKISKNVYKKYVEEHEKIITAYFNGLYKETLMNPYKDPDSVINDKSNLVADDLRKMRSKIDSINKKYEEEDARYKAKADEDERRGCKICEELHEQKQNVIRERLEQGILIYRMIYELQSSHKMFDKADSAEFQEMIKKLRDCASVITFPEYQDKKYNEHFDTDRRVDTHCNRAVAACRNYLNLKRNRLKIRGFSNDAKNRIYRTEIILNSLYTYYPETRPAGLTEKDVKTNLAKYNNEFKNLNGHYLREGLEVMKHYGAPAANKNQQRIVVEQKTNAINKNTVVRLAAKNAKKQKVPGKH